MTSPNSTLPKKPDVPPEAKPPSKRKAPSGPQSATPTKPPRRSQVAQKPSNRHHHGDLKEALLTAATQLMVARGRADFTLRELAQMAGVGHTATYKHFADKDSLLTTLALRGFTLLGERQQVLFQAGTDPWAHLVATGQAYISFALDYPAHFQVMFDPRLSLAWSRNDTVREAQAQPMARFVHAIEACQAAGLIPREVPVERVLTVLWSCGHGLATLLGGGQLDFLAVRGMSRQQVIRMVSEVVPRCLQHDSSLPWLQFALAPATPPPGER